MKRNIFLWGLYDLGNTPFIVALSGLYFAQWVVLDNHFADLWYGGTFALATIFLLFTSLFWGAWSDKLGQRMPFITRLTLLMIFLGGVLALIAPSSLPAVPKVITALILFLIIQYIYQLSLIFFNALLIKLSTPQARGKISGIGEAFSEFGWIVGPVLLLPFATGQITLLGEPGRAQVFLPGVLLLIILTLPMLLWFREPKTAGARITTTVSQTTLEGVKYLVRKDKNTALFLLAFMFISDAILTAELYFAIFLDQIYRISDTEKVTFLVLMQIFAVLGALATGRIADNYGNKRILFLVCLNLILTLSIISFSSSPSILYLLAALLGIGWGGFYTLTRALLVKLSPPSKLGEYFGFFATFQRFASIIGPLMWGGVTLFLKDYGVVKYRFAGLSLILMMVVGTFLLTQVKEKVAIEPKRT